MVILVAFQGGDLRRLCQECNRSAHGQGSSARAGATSGSKLPLRAHGRSRPSGRLRAGRLRPRATSGSWVFDAQIRNYIGRELYYERDAT